MAELKTKVNDGSVARFLDSIEDDAKRKDSLVLFEMMQKANTEEAKMWGDSIIGFGTYHYVGKSGPEGDWFLTGFSPRKQALTLYALGHWEPHAELLAIRRAAARVGRWRLDGATLYVTLEPCPMCAGAIACARLPRVVYGADDPKAGGLGSRYAVGVDGRWNHVARVERGVLAVECGALLTEFFARRR
jgi:tRNA(Arg) A34 adenosine deaminase TadA